jgi:spore coat assembly protein
MKEIKKGDIVTRKSYGNDILFNVKRIIKVNKDKIAILSGLVERIEVDSNIQDLEKVDNKRVKENIKEINKRVSERIEKRNEKKYKIGILFQKDKRIQQKIVTGKILHLDGDKKYSQKSYNYYKKLGLNAVVKNIPEYKQPKVVYGLLKTYNPDILIVTGHDGMIKRGTNYTDIYNYRNSRHFINTVQEARRYDMQRKNKLVIFAGACQSYFEALISAGANFASSPDRILIDFLDPLIVAEKVATTDEYKYITIDDIAKELRDGKKGVGGIGANGKSKIVTQM